MSHYVGYFPFPNSHYQLCFDEKPTSGSHFKLECRNSGTLEDVVDVATSKATPTVIVRVGDIFSRVEAFEFLNHAQVVIFERWMQGCYATMGMVVKGPAARPTTPPPAAKDKDCPECYGTGFRHGFGRECSKGCKVRS